MHLGCQEIPERYEIANLRGVLAGARKRDL
jgi:hypothetical protein